VPAELAGDDHALDPACPFRVSCDPGTAAEAFALEPAELDRFPENLHGVGGSRNCGVAMKAPRSAAIPWQIMPLRAGLDQQHRTSVNN
jgi:hypothetical protein